MDFRLFLFVLTFNDIYYMSRSKGETSKKERKEKFKLLILTDGFLSNIMAGIRCITPTD